ncbi:TonB-dependent receptor [Steroidobacter flavus]|uniref:TonB-dependent receptor n=1 Tax=Steroidobacter flavus TaxID=1842136 RepID=A0ABV8T051_9GAMM
MRTRILDLATGSGLLLIAATVSAQSVPVAAPEEAASVGVEEIVVTARRRFESLQDVPQTVNAVTSDALQELNLQRFEDVQAVVPGLTLSGGNSGYTTAATVRGASFEVESGATATVEFYLNDSPIQSNYLFQSMYDLGQIEVLRGPQGTLRGRASPSGSITVTSQRPDLTDFGGYLNVTATNQQGSNVNGAVNVPIVTDRLALRVAGLFDENDYDQVRSINNSTHPFQRSKSGRATLLWEPTDTINATVMYQNIDRTLHSFDAYQSFHLVEPTAPVVNTATDPEIAASDRLSITDGAREATQDMDIITAQLNWSVAGQVLSYVGSYTEQELNALSPQDRGNRARGLEIYQDLHIHETNKSHELRLASEERLFNVLDYTVGAFYFDSTTPSEYTSETIVGIQAGPIINPITVVRTPIVRRGGFEERSFFGNLTYHFSDRTELSGGLRRITYETKDVTLLNGRALADIADKEEPTIYNVAASHRFTDDFMVYVNHGKSWRNGPSTIGVTRELTPRLDQFTNLEEETSKSYEAGFKADWLNRRLRVNASLFYQDFSNFIYRGPPVYYVNFDQTGPIPSTFNFVANVDATVKGGELEVTFQPSDRLRIGAAFSYAKGEIDNGLVACNDFNRDGIPDRNPPAPTVQQITDAAGNNEAVASCRVNDRLSFAPDWSATLTPEYALPITPRMDAFVRGLFTYYPSNERDPNNSYDQVGAYGLLNLYAGIRSPDGAWEVALFAKNATNTGETLELGGSPMTTNYQRLLPPTFQTTEGSSLASPYMTARYTPPREIGLNVRYSFGSR